jgi:uncharacterized RDD family membrane protein YckC
MRRAEARAPVILTPEHVPILLVPAGLGTRFVAVLTDFAIRMGLLIVITLVLRLLVPFGLSVGLSVVALFVLEWGYPVFFEVRRQGQTPGKKLCGLRVVDRRGLPITFQQSFVRNVVRALDFAPVFYGVGGLASLLDRYSRRLGDIAGDTVVIQERPAEDVSRHLGDARAWNSLRAPEILRRIRRRVTREEREFLLSLCLRSEKLDPRARFDLMEEVGNHYRRDLGVDDPHLSGENLVRGLLSALYLERA